MNDSVRSMTRILYKGLRISNSCGDFEWEEATDIAREVVDNLPVRYRVMHVIAGQLDWRGRTGWKVEAIPPADELWGKIAGWERTDWTLYNVTVKPALIRCMAACHDVPTGSERLVKFMDGNGIYALMRNKGCSKREIQFELEELGYLDGSSHTIEQIREVLEQDVEDDDLMELLS